MKHNTINDWISILVKIVLATVVLLFLGSESIAFFEYIFPPEQWFMAYTGFGLTSGAFIVYLWLFLKNAKTDLQKTVAMIMVFVGIIGELATAGFGMQVEAWSKSGFVMAESDIIFMIWGVRILMLAHALALVAYSFGDQFIEAFGDADGDGVPNFADRDYKKKPQMKAYGADLAMIQELQAKIARLEAESPKDNSQQQK
jgi:hypothetical protein